METSDAAFYNWKAKYGGMTVSEAARLRTLEDENWRLKKLRSSVVQFSAKVGSPALSVQLRCHDAGA